MMFALSLAASGIARAQTAAATRDSTKLALIRELLTMTHSVDQAVIAMETTVTAQKAANPRIPTVFWDRFIVQARAGRGDLESMIVNVYERHLSSDELRQLIAFYKTPVGQKVIAELPMITQESMQAGQEWGARLGASIASQLLKEGVRLPPPF